MSKETIDYFPLCITIANNKYIGFYAENQNDIYIVDNNSVSFLETYYCMIDFIIVIRIIWLGNY